MIKGDVIHAERFAPGMKVAIYSSLTGLPTGEEIRIKKILGPNELAYCKQRWYHDLYDRFLHWWYRKKLRLGSKVREDMEFRNLTRH